MRKYRVFIIFVLLSLLLCACGNEPAVPEASGEIRLISVRESTSESVNSAEQLSLPDILSIGLSPEEAAAARSSAAEPSSPESTSESTESGSFTAADLQLVINGITLVPGADFLPDADCLGLSYTKAEGQACIGGGFDINYLFGDMLTVYTLTEDGRQIIYDIYLTGDGLSAARGGVIGQSSRADIRALYGPPAVSRGLNDEYSLPDSSLLLSFGFKDDILFSIDLRDTAAGQPGD